LPWTKPTNVDNRKCVFIAALETRESAKLTRHPYKNTSHSNWIFTSVQLGHRHWTTAKPRRIVLLQKAEVDYTCHFVRSERKFDVASHLVGIEMVTLDYSC